MLRLFSMPKRIPGRFLNALKNNITAVALDIESCDISAV